MKPKTSAAADEPTRTTLQKVNQTSCSDFTNSRLAMPSATVVSNSVIDDSEDEGAEAADFFSLDVADKPAMYSATFKSGESVDVRWRGSSSNMEPAASSLPPDTSASVVWNATSYSSPMTDHPPFYDTSAVRQYLLFDAEVTLFHGQFCTTSC